MNKTTEVVVLLETINRLEKLKERSKLTGFLGGGWIQKPKLGITKAYKAV